MTRDEALKLTPAQWREHVLKSAKAEIEKAIDTGRPEDTLAAVNTILAACDVLIRPKGDAK